MLKKAVITIIIVLGLIAATFIGIFMWAVSKEAGQAIGILTSKFIPLEKNRIKI